MAEDEILEGEPITRRAWNPYLGTFLALLTEMRKVQWLYNQRSTMPVHLVVWAEAYVRVMVYQDNPGIGEKVDQVALIVERYNGLIAHAERTYWKARRDKCVSDGEFSEAYARDQTEISVWYDAAAQTIQDAISALLTAINDADAGFNAADATQDA